MWMDDDYPADMRNVEKHLVLRNFTKNAKIPQDYKHHVVWTTQQYHVTIF